MDWKLKLKAILHAPPHKQWVIVNKGLKKDRSVAEDLFKILFPNDYIKDDKIETADKIASALSRIIVAPEIKSKEYEDSSYVLSWNEINFIDIFSGKRYSLEVPDDKEIKQIFEKISEISILNDQKAKFFFLFFWRFYPEIFFWLNFHPADNRAPNHSIYDHLVQTSAVVSALPRPAFLLFTIGPVQSFISKSRKTQDLWAGSYMLSYLTWESMKPLIEELGPDVIIFPNLLGQPLMDNYLANLKFDNHTFKAKLSEKFNNEPWFKKFVENAYSEKKLTIANLPNRFLAIVPYNKDLAKRCEERFKNKLEELAKEVGSKVNQNAQEIEEHLLAYFQVYWAILPWIENKDYSPEACLSDYKNLIGETELYKVIEAVKKHAYYKPANVGIAYSLLLELIEKLLGSRKGVRDFNPLEEKGDKCTLCGEFNQIELNWNKLFKKHIIKEREKLCGVCLTKRLFPEILKEELKVEIRFPSTSEMATIGEKRRLNKKIKEDFKNKFNSSNFYKECPSSISVPALKDDPLYKIDGQWLMKDTYRADYIKEECYFCPNEAILNNFLNFLDKNNIFPSKYYSILKIDGDNMGKWLRGEFNLAIQKLIHPKTKDALLTYSEGENKKELQRLLCSFHPNSPSIHQAFSRRLSYFALNHVRKIVEENHYGKLVYAGGDDVLAFLPIEEVLDCAYDLQEKFKEILGQKASMSAGILIVHHKYPLYLALKEVDEEERRAKTYFKRNGFALKLLLHSGEFRESGGKWEIIDFLNELICKFKTDELSSRFPYQFLETIKRLLKKDKKIEKNDNIYEIVKLELKRIYERKIEDKKFLEKIIDYYEKYNFSYEKFANIFIISRFLASELRI